MSNKTIRINWDFIGFSASFLCMLHCILLPICISLFPLMGLAFLVDEFYEILFIITSLVIASFAMYNGYKKYHSKLVPTFFYLIAFVLFIIGFFTENHIIERLLHFVATSLLVIAHYTNWRLTRNYKNCKIKEILR